jgi:hypothetical protein
MANPWTAEIARVNSVIQQTIRNIERDKALLAANPNSSDAPVWRRQIESGEAYLVELRAQLAQFTTEYNNYGKDNTASSGQVVAEEAQARAEGAVASNPSAPSSVLAASVLAPNGRINANNVERGTNDPARPLTETQATPPAGDGSPLPFATPGDEDAAQAPFVRTQSGVGAPREDGTRPNSNATAQLINASFNQRIVPEPNVLDAYASYTYAITWYLLTPDQYNEMTRSQKKNCASWQLLMQSGGAPTQAAGATANSVATAGRNKYFDKDYYIDDLEIDSLVPLKGTGAANTATDIKFRVTEPSGITLIENLYNAVSNLYKEKNVSKTANYPMAQYCLVVRFYGYNDAGELVTTGRRGTNGKTNLTDPRAIVEKFYPFVITNIKFRIPKDRVVEYEVSGKPIPHFYNKSQDRGSIPFAFELVGQTVEQVLVGKPVGTVYPASPGERRDTPTPNTSAPSNVPSNVGAVVNDNGNFTGETTAGSISSVLGA